MATLTLKTNRFSWLLGKLGLGRPVGLDIHTPAATAGKTTTPNKTISQKTAAVASVADVVATPVAPAASVTVLDQPAPALKPTPPSGHEPSDSNDNGNGRPSSSLNEMAGLIRSVRGQMNRQSNSSQRLIEMMQSIPESISTLPEINRNQKRMVEAVNLQLQLDEQHNAALDRSMKSLIDLGERQAQMMGLMQQRMDLTQQTDAKVVAGLKAVNGALGQVGETGLMQTNTLREMLDHRRVADHRLEQMVLSQAKTGRMMMIANWTMAATALGMAVWGLMG